MGLVRDVNRAATLLQTAGKKTFPGVCRGFGLVLPPRKPTAAHGEFGPIPTFHFESERLMPLADTTLPLAGHSIRVSNYLSPAMISETGQTLPESVFHSASGRFYSETGGNGSFARLSGFQSSQSY